ncbi:MAG: hypothetical protein F4W92_07360 [Gammaproteobacteria bacterium]|nr:hypothetical protein [Gammaproteobacteria bacterium]
MKSKDENTSAPLEAYYAAPRTSVEELLNMSEWGLIDKIFFFLQIPLCIGVGTLAVLDLIGVEFNGSIDGARVILVWSMVVLYFWLRQKQTQPHGKQTPKRLYFVLIVLYGVVGVLTTFLWLVQHLKLDL